MLAKRLQERFLVSANRPALWIAGRQFSYRQLGNVASGIQDAISSFPKSRPIGVVTTRSLTPYAGVLGAVLEGRPYLPLNVDYPLKRLAKVIDSAKPCAIILSASELDLGLTLQSLASMPPALVILEEDSHRIDMRMAASGEHADGPGTNGSNGDEPPAYIMFTSGTTGEPKGIAISQHNLDAYLIGIEQHFDFREDDRFSQFFNLSFDLSAHDMFVAWTHGASLHVPSKSELMDSAGFARRQNLSVWFSVPSAASLAMRFRKLGAGSLPSLRHALFCGEALSGEVARAFGAAAPGAVLTNLYGPTEATIAITIHRLPKGALEYDESIVPIGRPFPDQETLVLKNDMTAAAPGEIGELWLGGAQIAKGYTNNPEQTASKFRRFTHPGKASEAWYATGDLVEEQDSIGLLYRGRKDDQIKLHGHRIELTEVEEALRKAAGTPLAIVTPWPIAAAKSPQNLIGLVATPHPPAADITEMMAATLPPFMTPASIFSVADMAFNANGKLDRRATINQWIEQKN